MSTKLCVANLQQATSGSELILLFSPYGKVLGAATVADPATGRERGFGLVEMGSRAEAEVAIKALNGSTFGGRTISVDYPHRGPAHGQFGDRSGTDRCEANDK